MNADDKIVLLCGAPFVGRSFYGSAFSSSHDIIDVRHKFESNPEMTVRQLINKHILPLLKQNRKVIIDDSFASASQRRAYTSLLLSKFPSAQLVCIDCQPLHGENQLKWAKEFHSAEVYLYNKTERLHTDRLHEWRRSHEALSRDEGFLLRSASLPLHIRVPYHCSFPVLLLEWSAVALFDENRVSFVKGCCECINAWFEKQPSGRIIIINDKPPAKAASTNITMIASVLEQLTSKVSRGPVYLMQVDSENSRYNNSALTPGLMAFLQRIYLLDLHHEASVCIHKTESFQKISEKIGLKHIKANRAFSISPSDRILIAAQRSPVPGFLKSMKVAARKDSVAENYIPLWGEFQDCRGKVVWRNIPGKGCLYMASANKDCLKKYQEEFCTARVPSHQAKPVVMQAAANLRPASSASKKLVQRKLPEWMTSSDRKRKEQMPRSAVRSTMYIMNAEELLGTAKSFLSDQEKKRKIDDPISSSRVTDTPSSNTSKPSLTVPDSFVTNSASSCETRVLKEDITVSESLVANTTSARSLSTSVKSSTSCVKDSLVSKTSPGIPEVLVPETVTTVPETASLKIGSSSLAVRPPSPGTDLTELDNLFL